MEPDRIALVIWSFGARKTVHGFMIKLGLELESDLLMSLTAIYAKFGQVIVARSLYINQMWNAMISVHAKNGYAEETVELFPEMISK